MFLQYEGRRALLLRVMFKLLVGLRWSAVLTATLSYYLLGAAWGASPVGALFYRAIGFDAPPGWAPTPSMFLVPLAACFAASVATALLAAATQAKTLRDGLQFGVVVALGYAAAVAANEAVAPSSRLPATVFAILGGYHLVALPLTGVIVTLWRPARAPALAS